MDCLLRHSEQMLNKAKNKANKQKNMKNNKILPLIGCGLLTASYAVAVEQQKAARPNIIFILSDDHAKTAISAYGGINAKLAPTPNIDRIGNGGAIFNNMLCTNSISGPSRACLLTGTYSTTNGFYQNEGGVRFDSSQVTSATLLHANGYNTAIIGKWHLFSTPVGFDFYKIHDNRDQQGTYWNPIYNTNGVKAVEQGYSSNLEASAALKWLNDDRDKSKPFMLMLHFKAPHRPWEPDSIYQHLFDDVEFPYPATFNDDYKGREQTAGQSMAMISKHLSRRDLKQDPPANLSGKAQADWLNYGATGDNQFWSPSPELKGQELKNWKFQHYIKDYLRCVRSVDDNVGRVLDYLKANGLEENTIIIYMGDQGFYLGEHGWFDKRWMYEESLQMPCLVRFPKGIQVGEKIAKLGLNIDIAPTLLDYAGVQIPKEMQGKSLRPLLEKNKEGEKNWRKSAYYQYFEYPKWHRVQPHYGVRTDRYTLIHFYYSIDTWEFYDLKNDPNELKNQYNNPAYQKTISNLKIELKKLQKQYKDDLPLAERKKLTDKFSIKYDK